MDLEVPCAGHSNFAIPRRSPPGAIGMLPRCSPALHGCEPSRTGSGGCHPPAAASDGRRPNFAVVLYMLFSPDLADTLLRIGGVGVHSAVFFKHGDTPLALSRAVAKAVAFSTSEEILNRLFDKLEVNCVRIQSAFRAALNNADKIRTALEWSQFSGSPQRSFYRLFQSNGLPTPKTCLKWLRLMYAAKLLKDPGYNLSDVVHRLGYGAPFNFWQHVQDTLGLRASELRHGVGFETLLERFIHERVQLPSERRRSTG